MHYIDNKFGRGKHTNSSEKNILTMESIKTVLPAGICSGHVPASVVIGVYSPFIQNGMWI